MRESQNWQMQSFRFRKDNSMTLVVYEINFSIVRVLNHSVRIYSKSSYTEDLGGLNVYHRNSQDTFRKQDFNSVRLVKLHMTF